MESTENPWQIKSQETVYDNPWITLIHHEVINPSGNAGIYGKVHYKNRAIAVIALDDEMNTYLVGQYRFVLDQYSWEIPEGGGPLGTDPLLAAQRELLEETGLKAREWTKLNDFHLSNSVGNEFGHIFLARGLEQFEAEPEETEQLMVRKVPFSEVYRMVCSSEITDSMSVAAILRVQLMILEGTIK
jgi:ADP-ribose pyrophosphatase